MRTPLVGVTCSFSRMDCELAIGSNTYYLVWVSENFSFVQVCSVPSSFGLVISYLV